MNPPKIPTSKQESIDLFWRALIAAGKEVLEDGVQLGFGYSVVEVRFKEGTPAIIIRSRTESRKYPSSQDALIDLARIMNTGNGKASQTFTIIREQDGEIKRILIDEYKTDILQ